MTKNIESKLKNLGGLVVSVGIAISLTSGKAQEVIHFADPLNEIGAFIMALFMAVAFGFALFTKDKTEA
jgi:hypothetical protein